MAWMKIKGEGKKKTKRSKDSGRDKYLSARKNSKIKRRTSELAQT